MRLNPVIFGIASAIAVSILWIVCSALVVGYPGLMATLSGHMMHLALPNMVWTITWSGFFIGLVTWALVLGLSFWLLAVIYNALLSKS